MSLLSPAPDVIIREHFVRGTVLRFFNFIFVKILMENVKIVNLSSKTTSANQNGDKSVNLIA